MGCYGGRGIWFIIIIWGRVGVKYRNKINSRSRRKSVSSLVGFCKFNEKLRSSNETERNKK